MSLTTGSKDTKRVCIRGCGRLVPAPNVAKCVVCLTREINQFMEELKAARHDG